ncbi:MAG: hypothetical protein GXP37_00050 [Chloroflexi bacterium]|nr:hypothetical protein [Chloroflexota bacterium]
MLFRDYDPQKDQTATHRIWREVGWMDNASEEAVLDAFLAAGHTLVAEINDQAECISASMPGTFRYLHEDLSFAAITAVTTGRIARKQGLAKRLTARLIAADAAAGVQVAGLGIFEQGFYNLLGFGSGSYEHWISFDPAQLTMTEPPRVPRRLSVDDADAMHQALLRRQRGHGACTITPNAFTRADCQFGKGGFGLGLADAGDELTHFLWMREKGEHGPYLVTMMAFQNGRQLRELLGVLKNLGDQVRLVRMREPAGVQMQDFLAQPFRFRQLSPTDRKISLPTTKSSRGLLAGAHV